MSVKLAGTPRISLLLPSAILMGVTLPPSYDAAGKGMDSRLRRKLPHFQQKPRTTKKKRGR